MKKFSFFHFFLILLLVVSNVFSWPVVVTLILNLIVFIISGSISAKGMVIQSNKSILMILLFLAFYTFFICASAEEFSFYTLGKPLRMLVVYTLFIAMSRKMANYSFYEITMGIVVGLMLHLVSVYIQFFIPTTKLFFFDLLDNYEKEAITEHSLRAFGLCASFDAAGLCICVLIVLLWVLFKRNHNILLFLLSLVSLMGCFMVGRTAMMIGSSFFALMLLSLFNNNKRYLIPLLVIFAITAYYVSGVAMEILEENTFEESYRKESVDYLTGSMLYLPETIPETFLGTGNPPKQSDIGYIKIIHMIGLIGLAIVLYMYYKTINNLKRYRKMDDTSVYTFMVLLLALLLFYNYKLLLLYASGMNDLYFLLYFIYARKLAIGTSRL